MFYKHLFATITFLIMGWTVMISQISEAQSGVNSPFSSFGIGDIIPESPVYARHMGGISTSMMETFHLNFDNPSSLANLSATAFDVAITGDRLSISDGTNSSTQYYGNLGYLALGFPLRNKYNEIFSNEEYKFNWGMGFALMPYSNSSFDFIRSDESQEVNDVQYRFEGSGGSYKAMWSNAVKYGDLSLGLSIGGVFGKLDNTRTTTFPDEPTALINRFVSSYDFRGLYTKFGVTYLHMLNKALVKNKDVNAAPRVLSLGVTYQPNLSINTSQDLEQVAFMQLSPFTVDTIALERGLVGSGTLPGELALGITYFHGSDFAIGVDYRSTAWSKYENDADPEDLRNTNRLAIGGYWRPDYNDINSFFNRVSYRAGMYYEQDPRLINNERFSTWGITFGMGMPLSWQRKFSNLDIGVTFGKRSADILSESFVKFTFGFTFNDSDWFIRRKYN